MFKYDIREEEFSKRKRGRYSMAATKNVSNVTGNNIGGSNAKRRTDVKKLTATAMFSAIAFILMYLEISIPLMPSFIKLDVSDLPALLGSFIYGPLCGAAICLIKNILHLFASSSFGVGEISNLILGIAFVWPAGMIYKQWKNRKGALVASLTGAVVMSVLSIISNYFFVYPVYYNFMPKESILGAYQAIFPGVHSIFQALLVFNVPFTFIKGMICVVITWLIYIPISPLLRMESEK